SCAACWTSLPAGTPRGLRGRHPRASASRRPAAHTNLIPRAGNHPALREGGDPYFTSEFTAYAWSSAGLEAETNVKLPGPRPRGTRAAPHAALGVVGRLDGGDCRVCGAAVRLEAGDGARGGRARVREPGAGDQARRGRGPAVSRARRLRPLPRGSHRPPGGPFPRGPCARPPR